jgi:hypothetical protein
MQPILTGNAAPLDLFRVSWERLSFGITVFAIAHSSALQKSPIYLSLKRRSPSAAPAGEPAYDT